MIFKRLWFSRLSFYSIVDFFVRFTTLRERKVSFQEEKSNVLSRRIYEEKWFHFRFSWVFRLTNTKHGSSSIMGLLTDGRTEVKSTKPKFLAFTGYQFLLAVGLRGGRLRRARSSANIISIELIYNIPFSTKILRSFILRIGDFLCFAGTNFCGSRWLKLLLGTNFCDSVEGAEHFSGRNLNSVEHL